MADHCWPTSLPETPGHLLASLGQSVLGSLGSGVHKVLFVPSKSLFPQSCVSSVGSIVGLMATSSKRAYAISRSAVPKAPAPAAAHCWPAPPQEILKHSSVSVSVGSLGPGAHKVCLSPLSISDGNGVFDSKLEFTLLPSCWGFFFALGHEVYPHSCSSAVQPKFN